MRVIEHIRPAAKSRPACVVAGRRGFTLVELIIAILVLGLGLVLIAAIFPAGIAQQQFSNDDIVGRVVADHALSVIRSKVKPEDFGTFEQFFLDDARPTGNSGALERPYRLGNGSFTRGAEGDWSWKRPGFVFDNSATPFDEGKIDIFSWEATRLASGVSPLGGAVLLPVDGTLSRATEFPAGRDPANDPFSLDPSVPSGRHRLYGIPYNREKYDTDLNVQTAEAEIYGGGSGSALTRAKEPAAFILQSERTWPQVAGNRPGPGQYFWECMFRRMGGRIYVAIFVYRVSPPGGEPRHYSVARAPAGTTGQPQGNINLPPLPATLRLDAGFNQGVTGSPNPWSAGTDIAPNTQPGATTFSLASQSGAWQMPGQFILDKFNNVHRVIGGRRTAANGPVRFARPIPAVPPLPAITGMATGPEPQQQPATTIDQVWFLPGRDAAGNLLIPVFCTVQEL